MNKHDKFIDLVKWANNAYDKAPVTVTDSKLNPEQRKKAWEDYLYQTEDIKHLFSPYFIGYGNPDSDLLIIGKELGFDSNNRDQLINESLENAFHWQHLIDGNVLDMINFKSPRKPYGGIQSNFPGGHTWRLYSKIILNLNPNIRQEDSFLDHCFITEFNHKPSRYSEGKVKLSKDRKSLLKHEYFKSFSNILLTYRAYDKDNQGLTEILFDVKFIESKKVGKQVYLLYKSEKSDRTVVLTNQLSGSAGWSNDELKELAQLFE